MGQCTRDFLTLRGDWPAYADGWLLVGDPDDLENPPSFVSASGGEGEAAIAEADVVGAPVQVVVMPRPVNAPGPDGGCECWYFPDFHQQVKGCSTAGKFEVYEDMAGKFRFRLTAVAPRSREQSSCAMAANGWPCRPEG